MKRITVRRTKIGRIKNLVLFLLCLAGTTQVWAAQSIYLTRHAEKAIDGTKDPELSEAGIKRAELLVSQLKDSEIKRIFSTNYARTKQTAAPLAKALDVKVELYDPRDLPSFAEKIKGISENILIVGHSNTTPMLTHLLGGKAHGSIDESEYDRLYHLTIDNNKVVTELKRSKPVFQIKQASVLPYNLDNYSKGKNSYEMRFNDQIVGKAIHTFQESDDTLVIIEETMVEKMSVDSVVKLIVDKKSMTNQKMTVSGTMGPSVEINLEWKGSQVAGYSQMARAAFQKQGKIEVNRKLPKHTYERSAAILLAHLLKVEKEKIYPFNWYNSYSDELDYIELSYQGEEKITVPAGEFDTYKLQLLGGAPSQLFYISKEEKPKIIKIKVLASPWSYHLAN